MTDRATTHAPDVATVSQRLSEVRQRIEAAGGGDSVRIIGVTKTFPLAYAEVAVAAGLPDLGENYAQELVAKHQQAQEAGLAVNWHFIGGLQRNKVKLMGDAVAVWQTVDRTSLVDEIAKRCTEPEIFVQVNTTGEAQKSGCEPGDAAALVDRGRQLGLTVRGLMTIGPTGGADPRPSFDLLRELAQACELAELSMGMSADYEMAVAHGSTMVRLGSLLFGPRSTAA